MVCLLFDGGVLIVFELFYFGVEMFYVCQGKKIDLVYILEVVGVLGDVNIECNFYVVMIFVLI